jgi:hypothetical protein
VSKLGIEEGSCFLCGAIVLAGFSTATSAMVEEDVGGVFRWDRVLVLCGRSVGRVAGLEGG